MARAIAVRRDRRGLLAIALSRALLFIDLSPLALARKSSMPDPTNRANVAGRGTSCSAQSSEGCLYRLRSTRSRKPTCGKELDEMGDTAKEPGFWPWPDSLDAVVAASGSHRVVLENELTRVLEVNHRPRRARARAHPPLAKRHGGSPAGADPLLHRRYPDLHLTRAAVTSCIGPAGQLA